MGNTLYYNNQDDNYKQDHYQFHWNQSYENGWISNLGLHYTYGRGYFENYNLGYDDGVSAPSDYIDRRWLENDFYGIIFSVNQKTDLYNAGGNIPAIANTEEYNGTSWANGNNMITGKYLAGAAGTQTAGIVAGGGGGNDDDEYNV